MSTPASSSSGGTDTVRGTAPRQAGEFPTIVVLEPVGEGNRAPQSEVPVMDQAQQTFTPAVLLVRTGQPVEFRNSDDVLHNVRVRNDEKRTSAFNVAIPTGDKFVFKFEADGFYDVGCDIHPAMAATVVATTSPYSVLADPDGSFTIERVPVGVYKATVYAGTTHVEKNVTVGSGPLDLTR